MAIPEYVSRTCCLEEHLRLRIRQLLEKAQNYTARDLIRAPCFRACGSAQ